MNRLVSIIVPAFNEGAKLSQNMDTVLRFLFGEGLGYDLELIIVDDGSSDGTFTVAQDVARRHSNVRVMRHGRNRGLGAAIRTGFSSAQGSVMVVYDSDESYSADVIPQLVEALDRSSADLALASPYMRGGSVANVPWVRRLLSREANRFLSFAMRNRVATATCMVRAYRASFFKNIQSVENRMEINVELLFKAIESGAVIAEVPARLEWSSERADSHGHVDAAKTLKQIGRTLRYGLAHRLSTTHPRQAAQEITT